MSIIFSAYRGGVGGVGIESNAFTDPEHFRTRLANDGLNCNGQLALPLMKHMKSMFS